MYLSSHLAYLTTPAIHPHQADGCEREGPTSEHVGRCLESRPAALEMAGPGTSLLVCRYSMWVLQSWVNQSWSDVIPIMQSHEFCVLRFAANYTKPNTTALYIRTVGCIHVNRGCTVCVQYACMNNAYMHTYMHSNTCRRKPTHTPRTCIGSCVCNLKKMSQTNI